ncbi:hypothetical protein ACLPJK_26600 [Pseudomonas aeruginosa]|uniref:hypothetical protein n=1 Tax=Pseudomonas aeruginosa TaxID=287 RepID=UPI003D2DEB81
MNSVTSVPASTQLQFEKVCYIVKRAIFSNFVFINSDEIARNRKLYKSEWIKRIGAYFACEDYNETDPLHRDLTIAALTELFRDNIQPAAVRHLTHCLGDSSPGTYRITAEIRRLWHGDQHNCKVVCQIWHNVSDDRRDFVKDETIFSSISYQDRLTGTALPTSHSSLTSLCRTAASSKPTARKKRSALKSDRIATRWNVPGEITKATKKHLATEGVEVPEAAAVPARYCKDHPAVRGSDYTEISILLGTSGCSQEDPYWTWDVLGVVPTPRGKLVVCPGDWVITYPTIDLVMVVSDEQYRTQFV